MAVSAAPVRYVGIDISKATLDLWVLPDEEGMTVPNSPAGFTALIARLADDVATVIVVEATGAYHRPLTTALDAAAMTPVVVNPSWISHYARSQGKRAKTDRGDARLLACYGQQHQLRPRPLLDATGRELAALVARRADLIKLRAMEKARQHTAAGVALVDIQDHLVYLTHRIAVLEGTIRAVATADPFWNRRVTILRSVPGIGPVLSVLLAVRLAELGVVDRRQIASLAGVAPHPRDSGTWRGRRAIGGGRRDVCKALFQGSLVMAQHNRPMQIHYRQLRDRGKDHKLALIAVARRMVGILNAMVRDDLLWAETKVGQGIFLAPSP